ncbi:MAG: Gfo/Idh/MocA family oxidoreductase, partial [Candidatus Latescibacteria bacterium]|nr:Gfo/Idh/MocA family oxidoreductase [Candidatus Latescibacterota bacterium]
MDKTLQGRRKFIGKTAATGAALSALATSSSIAAEKKGDARDYVRVGCLNVYAYSHLIGLWGPLINARKGEKDTPFTNMRITHCWDIEPDKAEEFAALYGCEKVKNFDDMLGKVDGIISGGYYNHPWNHILHEPYLEAGLPNLINRPFANSLEKAQKIIDMAKKHNATILVPSSHEHNESISRAKAWAAGKEILCYNATNSFDDYPT